MEACATEKRLAALLLGFREPAATKGAERLDDRQRIATLLGQRVFDTRGDLAERLARYQPALLHLTQSIGQRPRAYAAGGFFQLRETHWAAGQIAQNNERPAISEEARRVGNRADGFWFNFETGHGNLRLHIL